MTNQSKIISGKINDPIAQKKNANVDKNLLPAEDEDKFPTLMNSQRKGKEAESWMTKLRTSIIPTCTCCETGSQIWSCKWVICSYSVLAVVCFYGIYVIYKKYYM